MLAAGRGIARRGTPGGGEGVCNGTQQRREVEMSNVNGLSKL